MLAVAGGGSRRSHATWEDNGRWMTVTITWEDDCRWMTVRGVGCGMGSVTWGRDCTAVEYSVDGSAPGGQVFGQWSRASGGRTQRVRRYFNIQHSTREPNRSVRTFRTRFVCLGETPSPRVRCLLALFTYLLRTFCCFRNENDRGSSDHDGTRRLREAGEHLPPPGSRRASREEQEDRV